MSRSQPSTSSPLVCSRAASLSTMPRIAAVALRVGMAAMALPCSLPGPGAGPAAAQARVLGAPRSLASRSFPRRKIGSVGGRVGLHGAQHRDGLVGLAGLLVADGEIEAGHWVLRVERQRGVENLPRFRRHLALGDDHARLSQRGVTRRRRPEKPQRLPIGGDRLFAAARSQIKRRDNFEALPVLRMLAKCASMRATAPARSPEAARASRAARGMSGISALPSRRYSGMARRARAAARQRRDERRLAWRTSRAPSVSLARSSRRAASVFAASASAGSRRPSAFPARFRRSAPEKGMSRRRVAGVAANGQRREDRHNGDAGEKARRARSCRVV